MTTPPYSQLVILLLSLAFVNASAQQTDPSKSPVPVVEELFIEQFQVPAGLFKPIDPLKDTGANKNEESRDPVGLFCNGVVFKGGRFAMYSPASQMLVVKGTRKEIESVRKAIADFSAQAAKKKPGKK